MGELNLAFEEVLPKHERLEQIVFVLERAHPKGVVRSSARREFLVEQKKMADSHADTNRLYRVFSRSGGFDRLRHGVYRLRPEYRPCRKSNDLTDEQVQLLRHLREVGTDEARDP